MSKWKDSRLYKPSCSSYEKYIVVASDSLGSSFIGFAGWMPTNGYTDGIWQDVTNTNGNKRSDAVVLYWMPYPNRPEGLDFE